MSIKENIQKLEHLITQQIEHASAMVELLQHENKALIDRDSEKVQQLSDDKQRISDELEALALQQSKILQTLGFNPDKQGITSFLNKLSGPIQQRVNNKQGQLQTLLRDCQQQNTINGQIIAASRQSLETAMSIVRDQPNNGELTYGPKGEADKGPNGQSLAKA